MSAINTIHVGYEMITNYSVVDVISKQPGHFHEAFANKNVQMCHALKRCSKFHRAFMLS